MITNYYQKSRKCEIKRNLIVIFLKVLSYNILDLKIYFFFLFKNVISFDKMDVNLIKNFFKLYLYL